MAARCTKLEQRAQDFAEIPKSKSRRSSEREDNLLANLIFDSDNDAQVVQLNKRISDLEHALEAKQKEISVKDLALDKGKLKVAEYEGRIKRGEAETNKLKEELKRLEKQLNNDSNFTVTITRLESEL